MTPILTRKRATPVEEVEETAASTLPVAETQAWSGGSALATRAGTAVLWALLACGPLGLAVNALEPAAQVQAAVDPAPLPGEVAVVGESAVQAVSGWLTATREDAGAASGIYPELKASALPKAAATITDASVATLRLEAPGVWSVTVGVDASWPDEAGNPLPAQRLYFEVPVAAAGDGTAASVLALPAPVPAPQPVGDAELRYQTGLPANSALGTTVGEFLQALLTGQGDVSRYVTPGAEITAVTPAPFSAVDVRRVWATEQLDTSATPDDGQTAQVLVDSAVTPTSGVELATQYRLKLTARAGRWEISQMQSNPVVRAESGASAPTTEGALP
ncbi:conjugal transfer protein [Cellulomonas marina]|uniref:Conjugative transposon protein TcpC n=1 Tax=Cellulomonas marina TaxID=988821 RepID=A0A1I1AV56_9CELL|nr:conjugal transfer protein [Cellulomonas marina]GIG29287.1 hypothetical protein Cma02nite_18870 [Cellulomonas marina]SFB40210.1 Conjugative transposon protein TcpC [Cellulomonas marina]